MSRLTSSKVNKIVTFFDSGAEWGNIEQEITRVWSLVFFTLLLMRKKNRNFQQIFIFLTFILLCGWRLNTISLRQFAHSWFILHNSTYPLRNEWLSSGSNLCMSLYTIPTRKVSMDQMEYIMSKLLFNSIRGSCKESLLIISNATHCYMKQCRPIMITKLFITILRTDWAVKGRF